MTNHYSNFSSSHPIPENIFFTLTALTSHQIIRIFHSALTFIGINIDENPESKDFLIKKIII